MPISLKVFFSLIVAIATWFVWRAVGLIWFPSAEHAAQLAHVPEGYRSLAQGGDQFSAITWGLQGAVLVAFGALIVFARMGWLRFVLAALIVFQYACPAIITLLGSNQPLAHSWRLYTTTWWHSPSAFVWLSIWVIVIVTMFPPAANNWLRQRPVA